MKHLCYFDWSVVYFDCISLKHLLGLGPLLPCQLYCFFLGLQILMSVLHTLVSVALAPATTPWGTTPAFAHLNICRWTEGTTAWVCKLSSLLQLHEYQTVWGPNPVLCIFFWLFLAPSCVMLSGKRARWVACSIQGLLLPNRAHCSLVISKWWDLPYKWLSWVSTLCLWFFRSLPFSPLCL